MKKDPLAAIMLWAPVFAWMGLIFYFSTERFSSADTSSFLTSLLPSLLPDISHQQIESANLVLRKLGHWCEYFILAVLLGRALHGEAADDVMTRRTVWTIILTFVYAASDELHQAFVPGRSASLADVFLDSFGGLCGAFWLHRRRRKKAK